MTNRDHALTNQDEFLKEYTEITGMQMSYAIDAMRDEDCATVSGRNIHISLLVWQAATKASESEINSLKERVAELQSHLSNQVIEISLNDITLESYASKIAELQADNNKLREALEVCKYDCHTGEVIGIAEKALKATSTQSCEML